MSADRSSEAQDQAACIDCGYPLRGLTDGRCPECGKAFDPADPKTMNVGRRVGRVRRWMLRPLGTSVIVIAFAGTIISVVATGTGLQFSGMSLRDVVFFIRPRDWFDASLIGPTDYLYAAGLWTSAIALTGWLLHSAMRSIAGARRGIDPRLKPAQARRQLLFFSASLITLLFVASGWQIRAARHWAAAELRQPGVGFPTYLANVDAEDVAILRIGFARARNLREATTYLKILVEEYPSSFALIVPQLLREAATPELRVLQLHLASLTRDQDLVPQLTEYLNDPNSMVRAGAADAIGIIHQPMALAPDIGGAAHSNISIESDPPISPKIVPIVNLNVHSLPDRMEAGYAPLHLSEHTRSAVENSMLNGSTSEEREAAARALVCWPPENYRLRIAEWGVWTAEGEGLNLTEKTIGYIPRFVHQPQDSVDSLLARFKSRRTWVIAKPVIHVYPSQPMAMDVAVVIRMGRPWFAYPMPDDFILQPFVFDPSESREFQETSIFQSPATVPSGSVVPVLKPLDRKNAHPLENLREGYPWVEPHHRQIGRRAVSPARDDIRGLGLRWQSVVALPQPGTHMPAPVPVDGEKYAWWGRLRDVPAGWLTSRGETERFLYYDGPTLKSPTLKVRMADGLIRFEMPPTPRESSDLSEEVAFGTATPFGIEKPRA